MAGRPAKIIKSDFCSPPTTLSKLEKPVDKPVKASGDFLAASAASRESIRDLSNSIKPFSD